MQNCGVLVHPYPPGEELLRYDRDMMVKQALEWCIEHDMLGRCGSRQLLRMLLFSKDPLGQAALLQEELNVNFCRYAIERNRHLYALKRERLGNMKLKSVKRLDSGLRNVDVSACFLVRLEDGSLEEYIVDNKHSGFYTLRHASIDTALRLINMVTRIKKACQLRFFFDDKDGLVLHSIGIPIDYRVMMQSVNVRLKDLMDRKPSTEIFIITKRLLADPHPPRRVEKENKLLLIVSKPDNPVLVVQQVVSSVVSLLDEPELDRMDILSWSTDVCYMDGLLAALGGGQYVHHAHMLICNQDGTATSSFLFSRSATVTDLLHNRLQSSGARTVKELMTRYTHVLLCGPCLLFEQLSSHQRFLFALE